MEAPLHTRQAGEGEGDSEREIVRAWERKRGRERGKRVSPSIFCLMSAHRFHCGRERTRHPSINLQQQHRGDTDRQDPECVVGKAPGWMSSAKASGSGD